jgi:hypothetical protein
VRLLALLLLVPATALAADGESAISITPGFATFSVSQTVAGRPRDRTGIGGALTVDYQHGFGDSFWVRAAVGGGAFAAEGSSAYAGTASLALVYAVDVLRYVPYISAGGGALAVGGGALETQIRPFLELGVGLEVEQSPGFAWGIDARLGSFASQSTEFTIGPRVSFKWGYF